MNDCVECMKTRCFMDQNGINNGESSVTNKPVYGALPADAEKYQETKVFSAETIPAGFKRKHSTKDGVWGRIVALEGVLALKVYEPELVELDLNEGEFAIASPKQTHSVKLGTGATFKVEFYRLP